MPEARHFYHSFPRPRHSESVEHLSAKGLAILRLIRETGVVLAPEVIEWQVPLETGVPRTIVIRQRRICFTELSRTEIREHATRFGHFSLKFNIEDLRRLGAMPVMYVPQHLGQETSAQ
jgi:hypothetical protein